MVTLRFGAKTDQRPFGILMNFIQFNSISFMEDHHVFVTLLHDIIPLPLVHHHKGLIRRCCYIDPEPSGQKQNKESHTLQVKSATSKKLMTATTKL